MFYIKVDGAFTVEVGLLCGDTDEVMKLDAGWLIFMSAFGIIFIIQYFCMLKHRINHFLHLIATTDLNNRIEPQRTAAVRSSDLDHPVCRSISDVDMNSV